MIGVVIVAHSARLAEGVRELADQMAQGRVPLAAAGGVDDPDQPLGTDALKVLQAIEAVYSAEGVLVLMDLGSAVLSAELALEMLPAERREKVRLCAAPLVEGTVAAVVEALAGHDLAQVVAEASGALVAKAAQLGGAPSSSPPPAPPHTEPYPHEVVLTIRNRLGLHARPAALWVQTALRFRADVRLSNRTNGVGPVDGKSINQTLLLGARQGHAVALATRGPDAPAALVALAALINDGFGEQDQAPPAEMPAPTSQVSGPSNATQFVGQGASPGIAIGPVVAWQAPSTQGTVRPAEAPEREQARLRAAIQRVQADLRTLRQQAASRWGEAQAALFDAHALFLADPAVAGAASQRIADQHLTAEAAWQRTVDALAARYHALDDPYLRARAADLLDVGQQVARQLAGAVTGMEAWSAPGILVATDLSPSACARLDPQHVLGICTALGSPNAHSAILVRALGIPLVVGLGPQLARLASGMCVALDGASGQVWLAPDPDLVARLEAQRARWLSIQQAARAASARPATTRDGRRIPVLANLRGLADVRPALECGAEGVGLLRTEFLFLERPTPPDEEEQCAAYRAIAEALGSRPLTVRTLDVGGDKPLPYLTLEGEANPFLGWRGVRISLDHPALLKTQLRAILRASAGRGLRVMFPLIATRAELRAAQSLLAEACAELRTAGIPFDAALPVGIMVETPAAVALADQLAAEVRFVSLGTNDLGQYVMAADRTHPRVGSLADPFHPAVLRMMHHAAQAARRAGVRVGACGEFAGDPLAVPLLLGLGVDELSINPPAIPMVKQALARLTMSEAEKLLAEALQLDAAEAVRQHVLRSLPGLHKLEPFDNTGLVS